METIHGHPADTRIIIAGEVRTLKWCVENLCEWRLHGIFDELDELCDAALCGIT